AVFIGIPSSVVYLVIHNNHVHQAALKAAGAQATRDAEQVQRLEDGKVVSMCSVVAQHARALQNENSDSYDPAAEIVMAEAAIIESSGPLSGEGLQLVTLMNEAPGQKWVGGALVDRCRTDLATIAARYPPPSPTPS